jgi:hypothetical protein
MFTLLSEKMNLLEIKEEVINKLSVELMGTTERENLVRQQFEHLQKKHEKFQKVEEALQDQKDGSVFESML